MILAVRHLFLLLPLGLLAACGADRSASTEVENEVSAGVLCMSVEDTALLPGVRWNLSTSSGSALDSGFANASGILTSSRAPLGQELLLRAFTQDTLRAVVIDSSASDTLRAGMNLLTDAVARRWKADEHENFSAFADSLVHKITGTDISYRDLSTQREMRPVLAQALLGTMASQIARRNCDPTTYLDTLATMPGRNLQSDSAFNADIARQYARNNFPLDSQALHLMQPDSDTTTQARFDVHDSQYVSSALPWMSSVLLTDLLGRSEGIGSKVASSLQSGRGVAATAAGRICLHTYAQVLSEIAPSLDSNEIPAYQLLVGRMDSSIAQGLQMLGVESWISDGTQAATLLHSALLSSRASDWSMTAFLEATDPQAYLSTHWPMPTDEALQRILEHH